MQPLPVRRSFLALLACSLLLAPLLRAGEPDFPPDRPLPAQRLLDFTHWTGLVADTHGIATLPSGTEARYTAPAGPRGAYAYGLWTFNDSALDLTPWYGLRFDIALDRDTAPFVAEFTLARPPYKGRQDLPSTTRASLLLTGKDWQTITLPFTAFDYNRGQAGMLGAIKTLVLTGRYEGLPPATGGIQLRNLRLVRGDVLHLDAYIRSQPAEADATVTYTTTVTNCTDAPQIVNLSLQRSGWEGMPATVSPATLTLAPGQSAPATVHVTVPAWLPGAARETQTLVVTPQSRPSAAEQIAFITLRRLPPPYLLHTPPEWDEVRAKVKTYDWARDELADIVKRADAFEVPVVPPHGLPSDQDTPAVFKSYIENQLFPCALAWKLTGEKRHAEKIALFLRRLADPATGYPKRRHLNSQGIPQEGGLWEVAAWSYDLIQDAGILTADDKRLIEESFRLYIDWVSGGLDGGGISNWSVFNLIPAAQCALAIQDMARFDTLMNGECGIINHLRYGTMDDGWWYEMSLAYNLGCAEAFTNLAIAARPFGLDLIHARYPVATTHKVGLRPFEYQKFLGMAFGKYGPVRDNYISFKKLWDAIVIYPDDRGVMFGMGDGHEERLAGGRLEKAYYAFRDPAYAAIIKRSPKRDLLYGVPELPADTPAVYSPSGHSDNAGLAVLRSQTPGRPVRDQIQAVLKYGTHGSYHGHFDRIALNALQRGGRSFYNPETSWFGYGSYMYKWWVQVSLSHNMVVVDGKMQEPAECTPLLFHSGPLMQAVAAETVTRWSNPPYMGGYDQIAGIRTGDRPYVPVPADHPAVGELTGFTEPVRQRRLMIVTDDYVVLADDLQSAGEHTYDNLLHLRGATVEPSATLTLLRHEAQFYPAPLGSGQFITNVNRYAATSPALIRSLMRIGDNPNWETGGAKSLSEPGDLHLDARTLWPRQTEIALADYAESWPVNKKLTYTAKADGHLLAEGVFGAWILGSGRIDTDITGLKTLELTTRTNRAGKTLKTLFWADAVLVTASGREIPLASLKPATSLNVAPVPTAGLDYDGGPVRIAGLPATTSVASEPANPKEDAVLTYNLSGLGAVRFKARVGGDWPVGHEEQLRKVCAVRTTGRHAQFLTVLEPYAQTSVIKTATAAGPGTLRVELTDGRIQDIVIQNLASPDAAVSAQLTETRPGQPTRTETTLPETR